MSCPTVWPSFERGLIPLSRSYRPVVPDVQSALTEGLRRKSDYQDGSPG